MQQLKTSFIIGDASAIVLGATTAEGGDVRKHGRNGIIMGLIAMIAAAGVVVSCSGSSPDPEPDPDIMISGGAVMTNDGAYHLNANMSLMTVAGDTMSLVTSGVSASVNGTALTYGGGAYTGMVTPAVAPGESISFSVAYKDVAVQGSMAAPSSVQISAPASGGTVPANAALTVSWAASSVPGETTAPSDVMVQVMPSDAHDTTSSGYFEIVAFSAGSITIPANTLRVGTGVKIYVSGVGYAGITGAGVYAGSIFIAQNQRSVTINTTSS
jgi:hypothetical protein